jgi:hypothetical protein
MHLNSSLKKSPFTGYSRIGGAKTKRKLGPEREQSWARNTGYSADSKVSIFKKYVHYVRLGIVTTLFSVSNINIYISPPNMTLVKFICLLALVCISNL